MWNIYGCMAEIPLFSFWILLPQLVEIVYSRLGVAVAIYTVLLYQHEFDFGKVLGYESWRRQPISLNDLN